MIARVLDILGSIALLVILSLAASPIIGAIEGENFPVTTPAILLEAEISPPPEYRTRWTATATKIRPAHCKFQRVEWFTGTNLGHGVPIKAMFEDKPQERDAGELHWTSLLIWNGEVAVREWSHAYVYHQCPWRWWETKTLFYRGQAR